MALASSLRRKARSILASLEISAQLKFFNVMARLELHFGESEHAHNYYLLSADIERLSRLAYPKCLTKVCDKIACSQFVAVLTDGYVKRTLQLEGITTWRVAVERTKAIKRINKNSFFKKREQQLRERRNKKFTLSYGGPCAF